MVATAKSPASGWILPPSSRSMTPNPAAELLDASAGCSAECGAVAPGDDRLFASCIAARRDFHIDPYGQMAFCYFVKDPALRYDLRRGSFRQAWDEFIPSLAETVRGGQEYAENCGRVRSAPRLSLVRGIRLSRARPLRRQSGLSLPGGRSRPGASRRIGSWTHVRYYQIAGITIQVAARFPLAEDTFAPKFAKFRVDGPGADTISIRLVSSMPSMSDLRLGQEVYRRPPWAIYRQHDSWVYVGIAPDDDDQ